MMKHLLKKSVAFLLAIGFAVLSTGFLPVKTAALTVPKAHAATLVRSDLPHITGNFIQPWLYSSWDEARWRNEMEVWKQLGIEYVIMGDMANYNKQHLWQVEYPTTLDFLKKDQNVNDSVTTLMNYCHEYGIKVILGIGLNVNWYDWDIKTEAGAKAMQKWRRDTLPIMDDIYQIYKQRYGDTFYGWYWVEELYNDVGFNDDKTRAVYAKNMAACFNIVLEKINALDPEMPLFFSPHVNPNRTGKFAGYSCTDTDKVADFWTQFISQTNFRSNDTLIPQASLDHAACHLDNLEEWTKVYADGIAKANKKIRFWSNLESFHGNDTSLVENTLPDYAYSKPLSTFCAGLEIVSKYCPVIFSFAYSHFYSPYVTAPGYHQSYLYYLETGKVEQNQPTAPNKVQTSTSSAGLTLRWSGQWDDFGIGRTNIYKNGKLIDYVHNQFGNGISHQSTASWTDRNYQPGYSAAVYEIEVIDVSGNAAEKISYAVCAENENNGVTLDKNQMNSYDPASPLPAVGAKAPEYTAKKLTGNQLFTYESEMFQNICVRRTVGKTMEKAAFAAAKKEEKGLIFSVYADEKAETPLYQWRFGKNDIFTDQRSFDWQVALDQDAGAFAGALGMETLLSAVHITGSAEEKPGNGTLCIPVEKGIDKVTVYRKTGDEIKKQTVAVVDGFAQFLVISPGDYAISAFPTGQLILFIVLGVAVLAALTAMVLVLLRFRKKQAK